MEKIEKLQATLADELGLQRDFTSSLEALIMSVMRTADMFKDVSNEYLKQYGLTAVQFNALQVMVEHESLEQGEMTKQILSERLLINKAGAGKLADRMIRDGLIHQRASKLDGRAKALTVTAKGRDLFEKAWEAYYVDFYDLSSSLDHEKIAEVLAVLGQLRQNISGFQK